MGGFDCRVDDQQKNGSHQVCNRDALALKQTNQLGRQSRQILLNQKIVAPAACCVNIKRQQIARMLARVAGAIHLRTPKGDRIDHVARVEAPACFRSTNACSLRSVPKFSSPTSPSPICKPNRSSKKVINLKVPRESKVAQLNSDSSGSKLGRSPDNRSSKMKRSISVGVFMSELQTVFADAVAISAFATGCVPSAVRSIFPEDVVGSISRNSIRSGTMYLGHVLGTKAFQFPRRNRNSLGQYHITAQAIAQQFVGDCHNCGFLDLLVPIQGILNFAQFDAVATAFHHMIAPAQR